MRALVVAAIAVAITGASTTAAHAAPSTSELTKKINAAQDKLEDITESYNKMSLSLKKTIADEKALADSLGPAKDKRDAASVQIGTIAAAQYMAGQVGTMNVLLEGPDGLLQRMSYMDQLSRSRQRDITDYTTASQDYDTRQAALKATQDKQAATVKELAAGKKKIKADLDKLLAMRKAAYGKAQETGPAYSGPIPKIAGSAGKAVAYAYNHISKPYKPLGAGPNSFDCSGLTMAAWAAAGRSLPHNAAAQYSATARVSRANLQAGDLVFYRGLGHVGIYVGGGMIIDAPHSGSYVNKRSINIMTPYGYGRVR
jgi:cell wall-associated NlpC family hydrolase